MNHMRFCKQCSRLYCFLKAAGRTRVNTLTKLSAANLWTSTVTRRKLPRVASYNRPAASKQKKEKSPRTQPLRNDRRKSATELQGLSVGPGGPQTVDASVDTLDWQGERMVPSKALQKRLSGLMRNQPPPTLLLSEEPDLKEKAEESLKQYKGSITAGAVPTSQAVEEDIAHDELTLSLPRPHHMKVKFSEYVSSSTRLEHCPPATYPEFAVVGRSNVGKSSLVNMLTGRRELALVSKTPGKTRCINHFLINKSWFIVDLPGYGYARIAKTNRFEWGKFTQQYLKKRETLLNVLLLVDASIPTQSLDLACAEWLSKHQIPFTLVFTKIDKRKKRCPEPEVNIASFEAELEAAIGDIPHALKTSSTAVKGKDDVLKYLSQLRELSKQNKSTEST